MEKIKVLVDQLVESQYETIKFILRTPTTNPKDVEYLILHLENLCKIEIVKYWIENDNQRILNVKFKASTKFKLLPESHQFYLSIVESHDKLFFNPDRHKLILRNVSKENQPYLTVYLKNLTPENTLVEYYESKFFRNTFIAKFSRAIDFDVLQYRNRSKLSLKCQNIDLMQAFHTNSTLKRYYCDDLDSRILNLKCDDLKFRQNGWCFKKTAKCVYELSFTRNKSLTRTNSEKEWTFLNQTDDFTLDAAENCYNLSLISETVGVLDESVIRDLLVKHKGFVMHHFEHKFPRIYDIYNRIFLLIFIFVHFFKDILGQIKYDSY